MGWLLRGILMVILGVLLGLMCFKLLAMLLPLAVMVGVGVLLWVLLRRLICGRRHELVCDPDGPEEVGRWRSRLDRINSRIESLETILTSRSRR